MALVFDHSLRGGLGCHECTGAVHSEHAVRVLGIVFKGRGFLLDTGSGDEAVKTLVPICNSTNCLLKCERIADINLAVMQFRAKSFSCALSDNLEIRGRFRETIKAVD